MYELTENRMISKDFFHNTMVYIDSETYVLFKEI